MPDLDALLSRLYSRHSGAVELGLDKTEQLLERLGNPQNTFLSVHVAGTNGKGSVSSMVERLCRESGLLTGLFTSPHLVRINERYQVGGGDISDAELLALFSEIEGVADELEREGCDAITFFEISTAVAFAHFRASGVQLAVLETGLGGRLDATNVVTPLLTVITSIALDHQSYLGDTLAAIAAEKAGIIKPSTPVVVGAVPEEALHVILEKAEAMKAPVYQSKELVSVHQLSPNDPLKVETDNANYGSIRLSAAGSHQVRNASVALIAAELVMTRLGSELSIKCVKTAFENLEMKGRFQLLDTHPPLYCDNAHNPHALTALMECVRMVAEGAPIFCVFGMCRDKHVLESTAIVCSFATTVFAVPLVDSRSCPVIDLIDAIDNSGGNGVSCGSAMAGLSEARLCAEESGGIVVVCGSVFLVGEVLSQWEKA